MCVPTCVARKRNVLNVVGVIIEELLGEYPGHVGLVEPRADEKVLELSGVDGLLRGGEVPDRGVPDSHVFQLHLEPGFVLVRVGGAERVVRWGISVSRRGDARWVLDHAPELAVGWATRRRRRAVWRGALRAVVVVRGLGLAAVGP